MRDHANPPLRLAWAAAEFAAIAVIFWADWKGYIFLSKTPPLLLLAWIAMRARGAGWREAGLRLPAAAPRWAAIGVICGAGFSAFQLGVTEPLLARLSGVKPDLSDFEIIRGNLKIALLALALAWTLAAYGEELFYRGYLLNRIAGLLGGSRGALAAGALVSSVVFGIAHSDQGAAGAIVESVAGLLLAGLYLASGRNLLAPIVAHGVQDTIDVALILFGIYPGM